MNIFVFSWYTNHISFFSKSNIYICCINSENILVFSTRAFKHSQKAFLELSDINAKLRKTASNLACFFGGVIYHPYTINRLKILL